MKLNNIDRFLLIVIILLLGLMVTQNFKISATAHAQNDQPVFPIKISNAEELGGGSSLTGFPTDDQGRFVVLDGANNRMLFCEVVWNGASASLMIKNVKEL